MVSLRSDINLLMTSKSGRRLLVRDHLVPCAAEDSPVSVAEHCISGSDTQRLNVVVTGPSLSRVGGQARHVLNLRRIIERLGHEFCFVPIGTRDGESGWMRKAARLVRDWIELFRSVRAQTRASSRPTIVHLNSSVQSASILREMSLVLAARLSGADAVLLQFHGCLLVSPTSGPKGLRRLAHLLIGLVDGAVALSEHQIRAIDYPGAIKLSTIPNGIELLPLHCQRRWFAR